MITICSTCHRTYDDLNQWTLCPHGPLWAGLGQYCVYHDQVILPGHATNHPGFCCPKHKDLVRSLGIGTDQQKEVLANEK